MAGLTDKQKQEIIDKAEAQLSGGNWLTGPGGLSTDVGQIESGVNRAVGGFFPGVSDPTVTQDPKKPQTAKQKQAAAQTAQQKQTAQYEQTIQQIANSPWTTAANALTSTMNADLGAVAADTSGAASGQAVNAAASQGLGMLGLSPSSSAGQWLASQTAASQANAAPVQAALNAQSQTYANEAGPISRAISQWGQDNAIMNITAPEQAWLTALGSHASSLLSYYGAVPTAAIPSLPYSVAQALKESGGQPGSAGAGVTPVQNIVPGGGGTSKVATPAGGAGGALSAYGSTALPAPAAGNSAGG
jgi:hypothetical protein